MWGYSAEYRNCTNEANDIPWKQILARFVYHIITVSGRRRSREPESQIQESFKKHKTSLMMILSTFELRPLMGYYYQTIVCIR